ncbi:hypothetical protein HDU87_005746 [Geranomyces variabilis]|uniref:FHA domain-containing protein n=1 Tax=Geranomyces variabilis TaxID=109894 RepID=A0AAD5THT0_9FUNG|nr:hypothetical protein HDU87_005746 [Geranomyces variabilis]
MSIKARASSESTATVNGSIGRSLTNDTARQKATKRALKTFNYANSDLANTPTLVLVSLNDTFATKTIDLFEPIKVGRKLNPKVAPEANNGIFDAKVLSRNHAEIWFSDGKVWVKDVKSSNGTFLNGKRLSEDNVESEPHELNTGDRLEFGLDIKNPEETAVIYKKVSCRVSLVDPSQLSAPSAPELAGEPGRGSVSSTRSQEQSSIELNNRMDVELQAAEETRKKLIELKASLETLQPPPSTTTLDFETSDTSASDTEAHNRLSRELEDAKLQIQSWTDKYNACLSRAEERDGYKKQADSLAAEVEKLKKQMAATAAAREEADRWKARSEQLEGEIAALKKKAKPPADDKSNSATAELEGKLRSITDELKAARDQSNQLSFERDQLSNDLKALRQSLASAESEAKTLREQRNSTSSTADESAVAPAAKEHVTTIPSTPGKKERGARKRKNKHQNANEGDNADAGPSSADGENQDHDEDKPAHRSRRQSTLQIVAMAAFGIISIGGLAYLSLGPEFLLDLPFMGVIRDMF